jgi:hypothetical protein
MNKEWHRANPMPTKATRDQRLQWHIEHARACGCRKPPADLAEKIERQALASKITAEG